MQPTTAKLHTSHFSCQFTAYKPHAVTLTQWPQAAQPPLQRHHWPKPPAAFPLGTQDHQRQWEGGAELHALPEPQRDFTMPSTCFRACCGLPLPKLESVEREWDGDNLEPLSSATPTVLYLGTCEQDIAKERFCFRSDFKQTFQSNQVMHLIASTNFNFLFRFIPTLFSIFFQLLPYLPPPSTSLNDHIQKHQRKHLGTCTLWVVCNKRHNGSFWTAPRKDDVEGHGDPRV